MTAPAQLIAEREFRAYATTASFWIALAVGPLVMAVVLGLTGLSGGHAPPTPVSIRAAEPALASSAAAALAEAADLEGRRLAPAASAPAPANLVLVRDADGAVEARFSPGFPLSASAQTLVARTLERDEARRRLAAAGLDVGMAPVRALIPPPPRADRTGLSRFTLVMILWLTLTGSLGMLLQAVVRERANRALEGLLSAARPWEIVLGKLAGVGAVSVLLLATWMGSAFVLALLSSGAGGLVQMVIGGLAAPAMLARAVMIYGLAYAFYGSVTVAVGASARDSAAAQNLSRPMFAVLLAAFFVALAAVAGGAGRLGWLVFAPPFTPFMLLLAAPGTLPLTSELVALGLMVVATAIAARVAVSRVTLPGAASRFRRHEASTPGRSAGVDALGSDLVAGAGEHG